MYVCDSVYEINNALLLKPITFPVKFLWKISNSRSIFQFITQLDLYNKLEKNTRLILIRSFTNPTSPQRNLRNKLLKENPYNFETLVSIGFNNHGKGRSRRSHTQNLLSLSLSLVFLVFMHTCAQ